MPKSETSSSSSSSSSSSAAGVAVHSGGGHPPRFLRGAPSPAAAASPPSPEITGKRRITKRGALAIALCVTAASYLSVLVSNSSMALSTAHHHRAGTQNPSWKDGVAGAPRSHGIADERLPERRWRDAAIAGITARAEGRLRASGGQTAVGGPGDGGAVAGALGAEGVDESGFAWGQRRGEASGGMHWPAVLPNTGRSEEGDKGVDVDSGTRSQHSGTVQRQRQAWLTRRARDLQREEIQARVAGDGADAGLPGTAEGGAGGGAAGDPGRRSAQEEDAPREGDVENSGSGAGESHPGDEEPRKFGLSTEERVGRMELGVRLWNGTYVPPIEPGRRLELIDKWSGNAARRNSTSRTSVDGEREDQGVSAGGRILYVVSSFDRGARLSREFQGKDKLDFVLMMMDEMREACEVGFSPHVHLIAAWELSEVEGFVRDRLFCRRTGAHVPYSLEEHPPSVRNDLSLKHRVYMKTRLEDFDVFLQVEDDVIVTLNHIMIFQEESEILEKRRKPDGMPFTNTAVPGFIRIEHLLGDAGSFSGPGASGEEWVEWEICLSRFRAMKIHEAGTYLTLGPSQPLPHGGNNQGMWLATRHQLRRLSEMKSCDYLNFDENSVKGHVETHSGSIQMFRPNCGLQKVFPARIFESFLVHHRTNNKLGIRGESVPGVPISLLRDWVEQFIRDESFLKSEWNAPSNF